MNPWDASTVGKNADGTYDVMIRATVSADGLLAAQTAALDTPSPTPDGLPLLADEANAIANAITAQLLGDDTQGVIVRFEYAQTTSSPGNVSGTVRPTD